MNVHKADEFSTANARSEVFRFENQPSKTDQCRSALLLNSGHS